MLGRKMFSIPLFLYSFCLLSACSTKMINENENTNVDMSEQVTLTFVQHSFVSFAYDENKEVNGYYFVDDELANTSFKFNKGHYLSQEDIDNFNAFSLNYEIPDLNGDGYWSFTFFTTSFDKETRLSNNYLEPCIINSDLTLHFAIYG
ncbi:MAG: hypothetical protein K5762_05470 [Bacilli bacterium]|nr:hypothetical protein [Bacilli bacterium]